MFITTVLFLYKFMLLLQQHQPVATQPQRNHLNLYTYKVIAVHKSFSAHTDKQVKTTHCNHSTYVAPHNNILVFIGCILCDKVLAHGEQNEMAKVKVAIISCAKTIEYGCMCGTYNEYPHNIQAVSLYTKEIEHFLKVSINFIHMFPW